MIEHVGQITQAQYEEIEAGEDDPFGMDDKDIEWVGKTHQTLLRGEDGTLIGKAGLVVVDVEAGRESFQVAGVGGVIVTRSERGKRRLRPLLEAALERAASLGPERAMLFCAERNVGLYERFGFSVIEAPVIAQQPSGPLVMPMPAMWRPLQEGVTWPVGLVSLAGPPF
jgi:predicted GNAT family N-acyltransferase